MADVYAGEFESARSYFAEAQVVAETSNDSMTLALIAQDRIECECRAGESETALRLLAELSPFLDVTTAFNRAYFLAYNSCYMTVLQRYGEAIDIGRDGLALALKHSNEAVVFLLMHSIAISAAQLLSESADAMTVMSVSARVLGFLYNVSPATFCHFFLKDSYELVLPIFHNTLGAKRFENLRQQGANLDLERAAALSQELIVKVGEPLRR
jgi:hypothetical protein